MAMRGMDERLLGDMGVLMSLIIVLLVRRGLRLNLCLFIVRAELRLLERTTIGGGSFIGRGGYTAVRPSSR